MVDSALSAECIRMHKIFSALSAQCSQISVFLRRLKSALCTVCGVAAACTVLCESNLVKREFHDAISFMFKGARHRPLAL